MQQSHGFQHFKYTLVFFLEMSIWEYKSNMADNIGVTISNPTELSLESFNCSSSA